MKTFWEFVDERMAIYERREGLNPKPWTDDPVLRDNFFTNCFRELDSGTRLAAVDIMSRRKPAAERLWNLVLYRRLNREETWRAIGGYMKPCNVEPGLRAVARYGGAVFTGAHQVHSLHGLVPGRDFIARQARVMVVLSRSDTLLKLGKTLRKALSPEDAFAAWRDANIPGVGAFLSWQLALDCRMGKYPLARFSDDEWAPVQAGALAGLKIVYAPLWHSASKIELEDALLELRHSNQNTRGLTVAAVEHSLCEYSKYVRIASGGHAKGKYR